MQVATDVRADGLTAPACAMWHYYNTRTVVNVFVVVSDEIENVASEDCFFGQLFLRVCGGKGRGGGGLIEVLRYVC